jgi:hypothetical protein
VTRAVARTENARNAYKVLDVKQKKVTNLELTRGNITTKDLGENGGANGD